MASDQLLFSSFRRLQIFSDQSKDVLQNCWDGVYEFFGSDPFTLFVWGSFLVSMTVFWGLGLIYTVIDLTAKPEFFRKYKIQDANAQQVSLINVLKLVKQVLFNQVITFPLFFLGYPLMVLRGYDSGKSLPTFNRMLLEVAFCMLANDVWFYCTHRILHQPLLYKHIHKIHHEWTAPISISALYTHPVEYAVSGLGSVFIGPLLLGSHIATFWLFFSFELFSTLIAHSGYNVTYLASPTAHDIHHSKFNKCFGFWGLMDKLLGTDYKSRCKQAN